MKSSASITKAGKGKAKLLKSKNLKCIFHCLFVVFVTWFQFT